MTYTIELDGKTNLTTPSAERAVARYRKVSSRMGPKPVFKANGSVLTPAQIDELEG